nr:MAG TPA: hypothetical protein [Caudoviricetes sp.]
MRDTVLLLQDLVSVSNFANQGKRKLALNSVFA